MRETIQQGGLVPPQGGAPVVTFEPSALHRLEADLGGDSVEAIVRAFLTALPERLSEITAEGEASVDPDAVRRAAHTLKSGAELIGATELMRLAQAVELGQGNPAALPAAAGTVAAGLRAWLAARLS